MNKPIFIIFWWNVTVKWASHRTNASALVGKAGILEIVSIHLNTAGCYAKIKIYSHRKPHFTVKIINWMDKTGSVRREHKQYVNLTLDVYKVCYNVSCCLKLELFFIKHADKGNKQYNIVLSLYPRILHAFNWIVGNNFAILQDSISALVYCCSANSQLLSPKVCLCNSPELSATVDYKV